MEKCSGNFMRYSKAPYITTYKNKNLQAIYHVVCALKIRIYCSLISTQAPIARCYSWLLKLKTASLLKTKLIDYRKFQLHMFSTLCI